MLSSSLVRAGWILKEGGFACGCARRRVSERNRRRRLLARR